MRVYPSLFLGLTLALASPAQAQIEANSATADIQAGDAATKAEKEEVQKIGFDPKAKRDANGKLIEEPKVEEVPLPPEKTLRKDTNLRSDRAIRVTQ